MGSLLLPQTHRRAVSSGWVSLAFLLMGTVCWGASQVSVSPKTLSGQEGSWLTVSAQVAAGATVRLYVICDLNGNGARDAGEFVLRDNVLKEGVAPIVAGSPAPGDLDGANGHLQTQLDFWAIPQLQGHFIVIVDDGGGAASDTFEGTYPAPTPTVQSIAGTLRDELGHAVAGGVWAENEAGQEWDTLTNAAGAFLLTLPPGRYRLSGGAPGLLEDEQRDSDVDVTLAPSETKTGVTIVLYHGSLRVTGRVVDTATSSGIAYMSVEAETESGYDLYTFVFTDANGYYDLPLEPGEWCLGLSDGEMNVRGLSGGDRDRIFTLRAGQTTTVNFDLGAATTWISGRVTKHSGGAGLPGFEMAAEIADEKDEVQTTTRADGSYVLLVSPNQWKVSLDEEDECVRAGYLRPVAQWASPQLGAPTINLNFELAAPTSFLTVNLHDADTLQPVAGVEIYIEGQDVNSELDLDTDASGSCTFGVRPGTYLVEVANDDLWEQGYLSVEPQTKTVGEGEVRVVNLQTRKAPSKIRGKLTAGTVPLLGYQIQLRRAADSQYLGSAETDTSGTFEFPVAPGIYRVQPSGAGLWLFGYAPVTGKEVTVASGETGTAFFNVVPPDCQLRVRVLGADNPLSGLGVFLNASPGGYLITLYADEAGEVLFDLKAGSYYVGYHHDEAMTRGFLPRDNRTLDVPVGATPVVEFRLRTLGSATAADAVLARFVPDGAERYYLDLNVNGPVDAGDVIGFVNQGK
ncbi:MAG: carboxypeptidase-like regulatory domain-containing protein [bacterium]